MGEETTLRLDKWLWYARFFKTRTQATKLIQSGKLRLNGDIITKPHRVASVGSILTFPMAKNIRVIKIVKLHKEEAQLLRLFYYMKICHQLH